jgi:hypothetical protein
LQSHCFSQNRTSRTLSDPSCRSNAAPIIPTQKQPQSPTAITHRVSIHVEFQSVFWGETLASVVTVILRINWVDWVSSMLI